MQNNRRAMHAVRAGFTLIELLLVMVILAVLAAVVVPKFTARGEDAKKKAAMADIAAYELALDTFEVDNGRYPSTDEGLRALVERPAGLDSTWKGYIKQLRDDPWQHPYIYKNPGQHNPNGFDLYSTGPSGQDGSPDNITNWATAAGN